MLRLSKQWVTEKRKWRHRNCTKNQKKIGAAENDLETSGPPENLREEAGEMVDEEEGSSEPAWSLHFLSNPRIFLFLYSGACPCYYKA